MAKARPLLPFGTRSKRPKKTREKATHKSQGTTQYTSAIYLQNLQRVVEASGRTILAEEVARFVTQAALIVAYIARFDRPFAERFEEAPEAHIFSTVLPLRQYQIRFLSALIPAIPPPFNRRSA